MRLVDSPSPPNVTEEAVARMTKGNPRITYMQMTATGQPLPLESSFKCWHCPFATTKHTSYVIHQQGHDANAKYGCKKCSYSAQTVQRLKNHDWVHSIQNSTTKKSPTQKRASSATANIGIISIFTNMGLGSVFCFQKCECVVDIFRRSGRYGNS